MKKLFIIFLAVLISAACLPCFAGAASIPAALAAYGAPERIDGVWEEAWDIAEVYSTNVGSITGVRAMWSAMYDDTHLYLIVEVTDPTVGTEEQEYSEPGGVYYWMRNTVQFFFDWGNERCPGIYDANDWGCNVNARGFTYIHQEGQGFEGCFTSATVVTDEGYTVEMAVDYEKACLELDFIALEGGAIGFGIVVCDADAVDWGRKDYAYWGTHIDMHADPCNMGTLVFGKKSGDTPVSPVASDEPDDSGEPAVSSGPEDTVTSQIPPESDEPPVSDSRPADTNGPVSSGNETSGPATTGDKSAPESGNKTGLIIGIAAAAAVVIAAAAGIIISKKKK